MAAMGGVVSSAERSTSGPFPTTNSPAAATAARNPIARRRKIALEPGAEEKGRHEGEGDRVARHRPVVEPPEGAEERQENGREIDRGAASPPDERHDARRGHEPEDESPRRRDEVADEERVEEPADVPRREGLGTEAGSFRHGPPEPVESPRFGEEPGAPGQRSREGRPEERHPGVAPVRAREKADGIDEEEKPEPEDEVGPHAEARGRGEPREGREDPGAPGRDVLAPARRLAAAPLERERQEPGRENAEGGPGRSRRRRARR